MKEIKSGCTKGTRILLGNKKRELINKMIEILLKEGFEEISIPILQEADMFNKKVGDENQKMMYTLQDNGGRDLCLAPEYTAVIMELAKTEFKYKKDVKLFYVQECFRGERPQAGRYRQFTQLGVEVINPSHAFWLSKLMLIAGQLLQNYKVEFKGDVVRGLDYYKDGKGFEAVASELGAQRQVCGGGEYPGGVGLAIGVDRLIQLI